MSLLPLLLLCIEEVKTLDCGHDHVQPSSIVDVVSFLLVLVSEEDIERLLIVEQVDGD